MHLPVSYKLTCIDKFMYMQACLASSCNTCMHALHVIILNYCHIVAICMGMTLLQLPNSLSLQVLSIKLWHQSTFAKTPSTSRHCREARLWRASMLVHIYTYMHPLPLLASDVLYNYKIIPESRTKLQSLTIARADHRCIFRVGAKGTAAAALI